MIVRLAILLLATTTLQAEDFRSSVRPFFKAYCFECHDTETKKGALDLETIQWHPADPRNADQWTRIIDRVSNGEMPPKKKARPPQGQTQTVVDGLTAFLQADESHHYVTEGRTQRRRLNRVEYENTVRDLLGTPDLELAEFLPEDGIAYGFDTVDTALTLSPTQIEKYLEAADHALDAALGAGKPPVFKQLHYSYLEDPKRENERKTPHMLRVLPDAVGLTVSQGDYHPWELHGFGAPAPGWYKVRVSGYGWHTGSKPVVFRLYGGSFGVGGKTNLLGYYELPPDKPTVLETQVFLESKNDSIKPAAFGLPGTWMKDSSAYDGPALALQWIEVEGPLDARQWPPASRAALLGSAEAGQGGENEAQDIIRRFAQRAFRRPVSATDLAPYLDFVATALKKGDSFEQAVRAGLKAVLVSPRFLQLDSSPGRLDGYALAARLSYFLWSTMPDEELLTAAAKGDLIQPAVLHAQVERMLAHPKARAFTDNFTGEWLGLRNIDATAPDAKLYPEFDEWLKVSMLRESYAFFDEVLKQDLGVDTFVHSNFAMLNERLAQHYGIPGVTGLKLRRVALKPEWHRGGVLTQAAILKVTANGTNTSPVIRGAWVLDRLLGQPVPPPPANIPAIEPDIRGATTIREQLAKHKSVELCATCHSRLDPAGFSLENYDVIGGWRDRYRITPKPGQRAETIEVATSTVTRKVAVGPAVDASDTLPNGTPFHGLEEFERIALSHPDRLAHSLAEKLIIYGTGHRIEFADRGAVDAIVAHAQARQYGFRTLLHEVIQSPLFLNK